jgi:hypothetical protein
VKDVGCSGFSDGWGERVSTTRESGPTTTASSQTSRSQPTPWPNWPPAAGRWKIENETFNALKTGGYNLEYSFGRGFGGPVRISVCETFIVCPALGK